MPAFNFAKEVVWAIEMGLKSHTIRPVRRDGQPPASVGDTLYLYTGMRTKSCRKLGEGLCTHVVPVTISAEGVTYDGARFDESLSKRFAVSDGFGRFEQMLEFFEKTYGLPFTGMLIKWDPVEESGAGMETAK